jgi:hypothetical protein
VQIVELPRPARRDQRLRKAPQPLSQVAPRLGILEVVVDGIKAPKHTPHVAVEDGGVLTEGQGKDRSYGIRTDAWQGE